MKNYYKLLLFGFLVALRAEIPSFLRYRKTYQADLGTYYGGPISSFCGLCRAILHLPIYLNIPKDYEINGIRVLDRFGTLPIPGYRLWNQITRIERARYMFFTPLKNGNLIRFAVCDGAFYIFDGNQMDKVSKFARRSL